MEGTLRKAVKQVKWLILNSFLIGTFSVPSFATRKNPNFCASDCASSDLALQATENLPKNPSGGPKIQLPDQSCEEPRVPYDPEHSVPPLAIGGRKAMALTYGSCEVLKLPVLDVNPEGKKNPYLGWLTRPGCDDQAACSNPTAWKIKDNACEMHACLVLKRPPRYVYGAGHGSLENQTRVDCSAFVSQAMMMTGAKFKPNEPLKSAIPTQGLWELGKVQNGQPVDCFDQVLPEVGGEEGADHHRKFGLKPGDLIVAPNYHVVMVDTVGQDPFGVQANIILKMKAKNGMKGFESIVQEGLTDRHAVRIFGAKSPDDPKKNKVQFLSDEDFKQFKNKSIEDILYTKEPKDITNADLDFLEKAAEVICDSEMYSPSEYKMTITHSSPNHGGVGVQRQKLFPGVAEVSIVQSKDNNKNQNFTQLKTKERYGQVSIATGIIENAKMVCIESVRDYWRNVALANAVMKHRRGDNPVAESMKELSEFATEWENHEISGQTDAKLGATPRKRTAHHHSGLKRSRIARVLRYDPNRKGCELDRSASNLVENVGCVNCCKTSTSYVAQTTPRYEDGVPVKKAGSR